MVTTDHLRPSHILLSCLHTPARLSNEHCVDIYFNIYIAAVISSPDPLFTYGSPYTLHLGGIYVVYFYRISFEIWRCFGILRIVGVMLLRTIQTWSGLKRQLVWTRGELTLTPQ